MSVGHRNSVALGLDKQHLDALLADPSVKRALERIEKANDNNDYDIAYLSGYSKDGKTVYFDRDLPKRITVNFLGHGHSFDPRQFLRLHETLEKALLDACGWTYEKSHKAATGFERAGLVKVFGPMAWAPYTNALRPFIKADEHKKLTSVPKDLDMHPYLAKPVNQALVAAMHKAMGHEAKESKKAVRYGDGKPSEHCGPVRLWPRNGECEHFEPETHSCARVEGHISARSWCLRWSKKE